MIVILYHLLHNHGTKNLHPPKPSLYAILVNIFEVSDENLRKEGEILEYLGVVREERHLVRMDELKYTRSSWEEFLKSVGLH